MPDLNEEDIAILRDGVFVHEAEAICRRLEKAGIPFGVRQVSQEDADALLQEISPSAKKRTRLWLPMLLLAVGSSVGTAAVILFFL